MSKRRRSPAPAQPRCGVCQSRFDPTGGVADRCPLCVGQLVLPFPPVRDSSGRFVSLRGAR